VAITCVLALSRRIQRRRASGRESVMEASREHQPTATFGVRCTEEAAAVAGDVSDSRVEFPTTNCLGIVFFQTP
jgi:hypothetical protein